MIEPIVGFLMCGLVMAGTWAYRNWFNTEAARHPEFERWVEGQPVVVALQCEAGRAVDLTYAVRAALGRGEFFNAAGGYPWQHYIVRFEVRRLSDDVVTVQAVHARLGRPTEERPSLRTALDQLGLTLREQVGAIWLHGRLRSPGIAPIADRDRMGWCGRFDAEGDLDLSPIIGQPAWLSLPAKAA